MGNVQAQLGKQPAQASFEEASVRSGAISATSAVSAIHLDRFGATSVDDRGDHDQALKLYKEALQIQRDIGNESLQAICLNNIGSCLLRKRSY